MHAAQHPYQSMVYYPAYCPVPLPGAEQEDNDEEDIIAWGGAGSSTREWESEAHSQYTYAAMPRYVVPSGMMMQPVSAPPAARTATSPPFSQPPQPAPPAPEIQEIEEEPAPASAEAQRPRTRVPRPPRKPPFFPYGHANTRPTVRKPAWPASPSPDAHLVRICSQSGGVVYGDYLATHNAAPGRGSPQLARQPAKARGYAQVHSYESDLRRTVAERQRANQYCTLPEYDARRYAPAERPAPSPEQSPASETVGKHEQALVSLKIKETIDAGVGRTKAIIIQGG